MLNLKFFFFICRCLNNISSVCQKKKKLQHEKPMVHLLHVEMVALVSELLSKFMKPKAILLSAKEILKVDVQSRDLQLSRLHKNKLSFYLKIFP